MSVFIEILFWDKKKTVKQQNVLAFGNKQLYFPNNVIKVIIFI